MNILIPIYEIQDYGGITAHTEYLIRGLTEAGHNCQLVILRNNDQDPYVRKPQGPANSYESVTGGSVHLLAGWYGVTVMSYGTLRRAMEFRIFAKQFDWIIWDLPVPYNGEGYWLELYQNDVPQVAVVHDAHYPKAYKPQLDAISSNLLFVAPVNESAYGSLESYPGVRRLIVNGIGLSHSDWQKPWEDRYPTVTCAHVWKAWKNMHVVVAAAPMIQHAKLIMGGDGIEGRYMRSKDKCKPKYKGLWDAFQQTSHLYVGVQTPAQLMTWYSDSRVMLDLSYNKRFSSYGSHFNRSMMEGLNYGAIPLVHAGNIENSRFWRNGKNCLAIDSLEPKVVAEAIDEAANLDPELAAEILNSGRQLLRDHFDYRQTCLRYLLPPSTAERSEAYARASGRA